MFNSDKNGFSTALGFVILGLIIFLIALYMTWGIAQKSAKQEVANQQSSAYHEQYAIERIEKNCANIAVGPSLNECINIEIQASYDHHRAQQDIEAQKSMALWTMILSIISIIALVTTIVGVVAVFLTLHETRRIGIAQTRAYLHIDEYKPFFWGDKNIINCHLQIVLKNTGTSPAILHGYRLEVERARSHDGSTTNVTRAMREVGPDSGFTIQFDFGFDLTDGSSSSSVKVILRFRYDDIYGGEHWRDVAYISSFQLENIPDTMPEINKENSFPSNCIGFVESKIGWLEKNIYDI